MIMLRERDSGIVQNDNISQYFMPVQPPVQQGQGQQQQAQQQQPVQQQG